MEINCAGERIQLHPEKAVYWPREKLLIIADVHFGKPAAFRRAGIAVPEFTTAQDLERLDLMLEATRAEGLLILGDLFHARTGCQPEMLNAVTHWRRRWQQLEIILISGNHDWHSDAPPSDWNFHEVGDSWSCRPFTFCHDPDFRTRGYLLAGHLHPAIVLRENFGGVLRAPCFCFGQRRAILPAFGSFTGMHNLRPQPRDRVFVIGPRGEDIVELRRTQV